MATAQTVDPPGRAMSQQFRVLITLLDSVTAH